MYILILMLYLGGALFFSVGMGMAERLKEFPVGKG